MENTCSLRDCCVFIEIVEEHRSGSLFCFSHWQPFLNVEKGAKRVLLSPFLY